MQAATMKKSKHIKPASASDSDCQSHINMVDVAFSMTPKCWWFSLCWKTKPKTKKWIFSPKFNWMLNDSQIVSTGKGNRNWFVEQKLTCLCSAATAAAFNQSSSISTSSNVPHTVSECGWHGLSTIDSLLLQTVHGIHWPTCSCHHWCSSQNASINWTPVNRISK